MKTIGEIVAHNVRRLRAAEGLSQGELAEKAKVSLHTVFRLESGKTSPQKKNLEAIAKALKVHQSALLTNPDQQSPTVTVEPLAREQLEAIAKMTKDSIREELEIWQKKKLPSNFEYLESYQDIIERLPQVDQVDLDEVRMILGLPVSKPQPKASKKKL